mmetsp:Transcript_66050/g.149075  ORF Transcript_66050/g.149075 Transcript_66050/m.149075 type:complete len:206 (+) Transcript_66050:536-1153(+)
MMHTTRLPLFSGRDPTSSAATTAAPEEMPTSNPSSVASRRAMAMASSDDTLTMSSTRAVSMFPGTKPAPIPCILWGPAAPPDRTADSAGSTATVFMLGFMGLRNCEQPVMVPPVPTPATSTSISPSHCSQISGPVVSRCTLGLSALLNCWHMYPLGPSSLRICSALATAPPMPLPPGVKTRSAPKARNSTRRSMLMVSGIVSTSL